MSDRIERVEERIASLENQMSELATIMEEVRGAYLQTNSLLQDQIEWFQNLYMSDRKIIEDSKDSHRAFLSTIWDEMKEPLKYAAMLFVVWFGISVLNLNVPVPGAPVVAPDQVEEQVNE